MQYRRKGDVDCLVMTTLRLLERFDYIYVYMFFFISSLWSMFVENFILNLILEDSRCTYIIKRLLFSLLFLLIGSMLHQEKYGVHEEIYEIFETLVN